MKKDIEIFQFTAHHASLILSKETLLLLDNAGKFILIVFHFILIYGHFE